MTEVRGRKPGRPTGRPKTGGRTKGTPNKSTLALQQKLESLNCDPMTELVKIARDPETETGLKVSIYALLMRHTAPVPKPVDISTEDHREDDESVFTTPELMQAAKYFIEHFGSAVTQEGENALQRAEIKKSETKEPSQ